MNSEHTIVKGASRLDSCAQHVKKVLTEDGYRVTVSKIAGDSVTQVHVAKVGLTNKIVAYAILNLWTAGEDLKYKIDKNMTGSNSPVPPVIGLPNPLEFVVFGGITHLLGIVLDIGKQTKLEEKLFMATSLFLTAS